LPVLSVQAQAIVKGDQKVPAISAASILAKVHRDHLCQQLHEQYPLYGFDAHKGYGLALINEIIGGFIVKMNDFKYNASVSEAISRLHKEFDKNLYIKGF